MSGPIALIGGEEFSNGFEGVHAALLEAAGAGRGRRVRAVYLPFNAADDGAETVACWSGEAQDRLEALGAQVSAPPIVDRLSADDPANARLIRSADWIYVGGGKPQVGMRVFAGTRCHRALLAAHRGGALLTGASAGAMILCASSWVITDDLDESIGRMVASRKDPEDWDLPILSPLKCLGILPGCLVWPHFDQFFSLSWLKRGMKPDGDYVIGIDEQTALLSGVDGSWQVLGRGRVATIDNDYDVQEFRAGAALRLPPTTAA